MNNKLDNELKVEPKRMLLWMFKFTKIVIAIVTFLFIAESIFSGVAIFYAMKYQGTFSYLDTFITDNGETFRQVVGIYIISKTIENVFKYNDGSIFGKSIGETMIGNEEQSTTTNTGGTTNGEGE